MNAWGEVDEPPQSWERWHAQPIRDFTRPNFHELARQILKILDFRLEHLERRMLVILVIATWST